MGIVIAQRLQNAKITVELVYEWYHQESGHECPIDLSYLKREADKYGVNWLGVFVTAMLTTRYFTHEHFLKFHSSIGQPKFFFSHNEGIKCLIQLLALTGNTPIMNTMPSYLYVLPSIAAHKSHVVRVEHFANYPGNQEHFETLYNKISDYCLEHVQDDSLQPASQPELVEVEPAPAAKGRSVYLKTALSVLARLSWGVLVKFFPWLGWLSLIVYSIIDFLTK